MPGPLNETPPISPRAVLRVGIVGHCPNELPPSTNEALAAILREGMLMVESAFSGTLARERNSDFFSAQRPLLRIVTAMAEGADLIAARITAERRENEIGIQWSLEAVLPARREAFIAASRASVASDAPGCDVEQDIAAAIAMPDLLVELPYEAPLSEDASSGGGNLNHRRAGEFLLRQSDILIAVWNGVPPGAPDGVAAFVQRARAGDVPVLLVDPAGAAPIRLVCGHNPPRALDAVALQELIEAILLPPVEKNDHPRHRPALLERLAGHPLPRVPLRAKFAAFLGSSRPRDAGPQLYERMANTLSGLRGLRSRSWPDDANDWRRAVWDKAHRQGMVGEQPEGSRPADAQSTSAHGNALSDTLLPRFCHADDLARHNANRYRSAYVAAYLLSAMAVLVAMLGFTLDTGLDVYLQKAILAAVELGILALIAFAIIMRGQTGRWHEKWIDYRALAEALRHQRFLALIGEYGHLSAGHDARRPWWLWYVQATIREIGMPLGHLDAKFQRSVLATTRLAELAPQLDYHCRNRERMRRLDHSLHLAGYAAFWTAALALLLYLLVYLSWIMLPGPIHAAGGEVAKHGPAWLLSLKVVVGGLAAVLPAFGAAIAGIRYTGEFEGSASRSDAMVAQLEDLVAAFEHAEAGKPDFELVRDLLTSTAEVMTQDQDAFWQLYGRRRLTLPG